MQSWIVLFVLGPGEWQWAGFSHTFCCEDISLALQVYTELLLHVSLGPGIQR